VKPEINYLKIQPYEPMLEHEIQLRASELYLRRGSVEGHALADWLSAEAEVLREKGTHGGLANQAPVRAPRERLK
jgi:hypothetical protein